jgi:hypothetical protein
VSATNWEYPGRKFFLTAASLLATWAGLAFSLITEPSAVHLTTVILSLYFAGNVGTKVTDYLRTKQ